MNKIKENSCFRSFVTPHALIFGGDEFYFYFRASPIAAGSLRVITGFTLGVETCFAAGLWFFLCGNLRRHWERPCRLFCDVWFLEIVCLMLVSGCYFQFTFLHIKDILETVTVTFGTQNLLFGRPGASTLAPWESMGRSMDTQEHKKGDLGV